MSLALDEVDRAGEERAKKAALAMISYLAKETPVDSSRALSNWLVSVGIEGPRKVYIQARYHGYAGSTRWQSVRATEHEAARILSRRLGRRSIFIVNNAPYIQRLNRGWSSQSPGGFIEAAILIGRRIAQRGWQGG